MALADELQLPPRGERKAPAGGRGFWRKSAATSRAETNGLCPFPIQEKLSSNSAGVYAGMPASANPFLSRVTIALALHSMAQHACTASSKSGFEECRAFSIDVALTSTTSTYVEKSHMHLRAASIVQCLRKMYMRLHIVSPEQHPSTIFLAQRFSTRSESLANGRRDSNTSRITFASRNTFMATPRTVPSFHHGVRRRSCRLETFLSNRALRVHAGRFPRLHSLSPDQHLGGLEPTRP